MAGRDCGTGPLTLQVTWYSRICNDTERNGDRVARRDCFKSFILPPSRRDVNDAGQPTPGRATCQDVKKNSLHENTRKLPSIRVFNDLDCTNGCVCQGPYPLLFRRLCAGYPQCFTQRISSKSAAFPLLFLIICTWNSSGKGGSIFRNVFAAIPKELAGSTGGKNGEKRAGKGGCGKVGRSWLVVGFWRLAVGRCSTGGAVLSRVCDAQRLWHVEHLGVRCVSTALKAAALPPHSEIRTNPSRRRPHRCHPPLRSCRNRPRGRGRGGRGGGFRGSASLRRTA